MCGEINFLTCQMMYQINQIQKYCCHISGTVYMFNICICLDTSTGTLIPRATQAHTKNTPSRHSKTYMKRVRLVFAGVLKRVRFISRSQNSERSSTKTIYTSEPKSPKATIIRHGTIKLLLLFRTQRILDALLCLGPR